MNKIMVIGLGPGSGDYMLPAARKAVEACDVIVGGKRTIAALGLCDKATMEIGSDLTAVVSYIKENCLSKRIAVVTSGDPTFYSILAYLKKHFDADDITVVPGLSSLQYMFARIGITWEGFYLGSTHGRESDVASLLGKYRGVALVTDGERSCGSIAQKLTERGMGGATIFVGSNLSYEDEVIMKSTARELAKQENDGNLSVVVILNE